MSSIKSKYRIIVSHQKLPNGVQKSFHMVDHPGAVLIIPYLFSNTILLLRQYRPSIGKYIYELPCGTIDKGESPLACAKRELIEETGYQARYMKKLGYIYPAPGYTNEIIYIYKAHGLHEKQATQDDDEIIELQQVSPTQIKRLVSRRLINDGKTICALVYCGLYK